MSLQYGKSKRINAKGERSVSGEIDGIQRGAGPRGEKPPHPKTAKGGHRERGLKKLL